MAGRQSASALLLCLFLAGWSAEAALITKSRSQRAHASKIAAATADSDTTDDDRDDDEDEDDKDDRDDSDGEDDDDDTPATGPKKQEEEEPLGEPLALASVVLSQVSGDADGAVAAANDAIRMASTLAPTVAPHVFHLKIKNKLKTTSELFNIAHETLQTASAPAPAGAAQPPRAISPSATAPAAKPPKAISPEQQEVLKLEKALTSNKLEQAKLKAKLKFFMNRSESDEQIDFSSQLVANETSSVAMASMLGSMWKDLRMFGMPFYAEHVHEELEKLDNAEKKLKDKLKKAKDKLKGTEKAGVATTTLNARVNAGETKLPVENHAGFAVGDKIVIDEGAKNEEKNEISGFGSITLKNPLKFDHGAGVTISALPEEKRTAEAVKEHVTGAAENAITPLAGQQSQKTWNFWLMNDKAKESFLAGSFVYVVAGIAVAFLYNKARKDERTKQMFTPAGQTQFAKSPSNFSFSILGCFADPNLCVLGCCCPCLRWADTMDKRKLMSYWKAFLCFFLLTALYGFTWGIAPIIVVILGVSYRQKLRKNYDIESGTAKSIFFDALAWLFCQPCAIIQEAREESASGTGV